MIEFRQLMPNGIAFNVDEIYLDSELVGYVDRKPGSHVSIIRRDLVSESMRHSIVNQLNEFRNETCQRVVINSPVYEFNQEEQDAT